MRNPHFYMDEKIEVVRSVMSWGISRPTFPLGHEP